MIALTQLKDMFQEALNSQGVGQIFVLHPDTGAFVESQRNYNDVLTKINGIYSNVSSNMETTVDGLTIISMTNKVELLVPCKDEEENVSQKIEYRNDAGIVTNYGTEIYSGNITWLNIIRQAIDNVCEKNGFREITDPKGEKYIVSYVYNLASTGTRQIDSLAGDYFTFTIYADYVFIKGGINSRSFKIYIDGAEAVYSTATLKKVPTQENNVYAGENIGRSLTSDKVMAVSMALPATLDNNVCDKIFEYLLKDDILTHIAYISTPKVERIFLAQFGETDGTATGVLNMGLSLSLVETVANYELLQFDESLYIYEATSTNTVTLSVAAGTDVCLYDFSKKKGYHGTNNVSMSLEKGGMIISTREITNASSYLTLIRAGV